VAAAHRGGGRRAHRARRAHAALAPPQIEGGLTERAQAALSAAGISGAGVRFDGRDATITGLTGAAAERAAQVVAGATGVRVAVVGGGAAAPVRRPHRARSGALRSARAPLPLRRRRRRSRAGARSGARADARAVPAPAPASEPAPGRRPHPAGAAPAPTPRRRRRPPATWTPQRSRRCKRRSRLWWTAAPITFGPDSPQLTAQGAATLAQVLTAVRAAAGARLEIDGYVATGRGNGLLTAQQLSDQRAATVRDALVAGGVPADRLTARGRGEDAAATDRALGRRVEITVV
jgi:outer membrane protein OmpA-like peptidoglycan-associated protein